MTAPAPRSSGAWRRARRILLDPRTLGVMQAGPRTLRFMSRARNAADGDSAAVFNPSFGLAAQVLLDEVLIAAMRNPRLFPHGDDYERAGAEIRQAHSLWTERGWLADPASYHDDPPVPSGWTTRREVTINQSYEALTFPSGYEPRPGEPGRDRWLERRANHTMHAAVVRTRHPDRPWLLCIHGFGTGRPSLDFRAFRARHLSRDLGVNLMFPVLPVHGPRQEPGADVGEGFMSINLLDSVHGMAQSVWDVRSCIRWLHSQFGPAAVGVYGISLGGHVAALTASLESDLACVIAGVPAVDMADLYQRHAPPAVRRRALQAGALGPEANAVYSVVSPLVLKPKVPLAGRYMFAGLGDRMANFGQAERLWRHWDRPRMASYPGGHLGFYWAAGLRDFVDGALVETGLAERPLALTLATSSSRASATPSDISHSSGTSSRQARNPKPTDSM